MADISKIKLPSGQEYDIKDAVARQMISGGVSFIIAWNGQGTPDPTKIPEGVSVSKPSESEPYTGELQPVDAQAGAFYLVLSETLTGGTLDDQSDAYDEYVVVKPDPSDDTTWFWEKIGDTKLSLADIVTDVTLVKQTDTVIGSNATFTVTQPTVSMSTSSSSGTGKVPVVTGISSVSPGGNDNVSAVTGYNSPSTAKVIGSSATFSHTDPTYSISAGSSGASVATGITPTTSYVKATASGGAVSASGNVTVVTGYNNPQDASFIYGIGANKTKLVTTSITGVSGSTTASKAASATSQTTAKGTATASTVNSNILKNVSVSNETLMIGACTLDTQTTTQQTFSDVTVPVAASATTVATGSASAAGTGAEFVTSVSSSTATAITSLGLSSTADVLIKDATFTVTNPTITLAKEASSGTGKVAVNDYTATTTKLSISKTAAGSVSFNSKDEKTVLTGLGTPTTDSVLGVDTTFGGQASTAYLGATATGGNVAWNSKDQVTALINTSSITVSKGGSN